MFSISKQKSHLWEAKAFKYTAFPFYVTATYILQQTLGSFNFKMLRSDEKSRKSFFKRRVCLTNQNINKQIPFEISFTLSSAEFETLTINQWFAFTSCTRWHSPRLVSSLYIQPAYIRSEQAQPEESENSVNCANQWKYRTVSEACKTGYIVYRRIIQTLLVIVC